MGKYKLQLLHSLTQINHLWQSKFTVNY